MEATVPHNDSKILSIQLNSFLHRIDCKAKLLELAALQGCSLKRIRRSKNWSLMGSQPQLMELRARLQQKDVLWIAKEIDKALPKPTFDLALIISSHPAMTVNQLMSETGCTPIEARLAIDRAEGFH